jgi:hypothetical protein
MLRWTVSDGRARSTLMGIKPSVRQGNMLGRLAVVVASGGAQAKGDGRKVRGVNDLCVPITLSGLVERRIG